MSEFILFILISSMLETLYISMHIISLGDIKTLPMHIDNIDEIKTNIKIIIIFFIIFIINS